MIIKRCSNIQPSITFKDNFQSISNGDKPKLEINGKEEKGDEVA